jgi:stage II sporulation protein D
MMVNKRWRMMLTMLLTIGLFVPVVGWNQVALANVPSLDRIRVALFIDTGKYFRQVVPYVTLSGAQGLNVAFKTPAGNVQVLSSSDSGKHRFSVDQYTLQVLQTADWNAVQQTLQMLQSQKISATVWIYATSKQKRYAVVSGSYSTVEKASAASYAITTATGLTPEIKGSERWVAGEFTVETDAKALVDQIMDAGFSAYLVLTPSADGQQAYQVHVGDAGNLAELEDLKASFNAALPGVALTAVDPSVTALMKRNTVLSDGSRISHYFFSKSQKLSVAPVGSDSTISTVQISEKGGRKYRGLIELSAYGGNMAVINELPMEHYLYSVVSSEMAGGWPPEALKAQTVAARTYAVGLGLKYVIAHLSDSTYDQAYKGFTIEKEDVRAAVDATSGQILMYNGKLATAYYASNAGGKSAHPSEVWGGDIPNLKVVDSPDEVVWTSTPYWYHVMLKDGTLGYVHSDYVRVLSKKHPSGKGYVEVLVPNLNLRTGPSTTEHASIRSLNVGDEALVLEQVRQNSSFSWIAGPYTANDLAKKMNTYAPNMINAPLYSIEVAGRGPSGRVTKVNANDQPIAVTSPDRYRTVFGGLRSTLFNIEETGRYTLLASAGRRLELPQSNPNSLAIVSAGGKVTEGINGGHDHFFILGASGKERIATESVQFRFIGKGYGHGLGMSQWGAYGLAKGGYDYQQILKHYYSEDIRITPVTQ